MIEKLKTAIGSRMGHIETLKRKRDRAKQHHHYIVVEDYQSKIDIQQKMLERDREQLAEIEAVDRARLNKIMSTNFSSRPQEA